ncbi:hypothetical protein HDU93_006142 [Gonapodya sp. JEL0774]|nr:hypothetical protein HDU93_006142 [Gonapodya sp. JEL0774]
MPRASIAVAPKATPPEILSRANTFDGAVSDLTKQTQVRSGRPKRLSERLSDLNVVASEDRDGTSLMYASISKLSPATAPRRMEMSPEPPLALPPPNPHPYPSTPPYPPTRTAVSPMYLQLSAIRSPTARLTRLMSSISADPSPRDAAALWSLIQFPELTLAQLALALSAGAPREAILDAAGQRIARDPSAAQNCPPQLFKAAADYARIKSGAPSSNPYAGRIDSSLSRSPSLAHSVASEPDMDITSLPPLQFAAAVSRAQGRSDSHRWTPSLAARACAAYLSVRPEMEEAESRAVWASVRFSDMRTDELEKWVESGAPMDMVLGVLVERVRATDHERQTSITPASTRSTPRSTPTPSTNRGSLDRPGSGFHPDGNNFESPRASGDRYSFDRTRPSIDREGYERARMLERLIVKEDRYALGVPRPDLAPVHNTINPGLSRSNSASPRNRPRSREEMRSLSLRGGQSWGLSSVAGDLSRSDSEFGSRGSGSEGRKSSFSFFDRRKGADGVF